MAQAAPAEVKADNANQAHNLDSRANPAKAVRARKAGNVQQALKAGNRGNQGNGPR